MEAEKRASSSISVNNTIRIPTSLGGDFFRLWLNFLSPFHELTPREMDVATAFIRHRFELSKSITDEVLLDKIVMNEDSKRKIKADCNISDAHFQVIMGKLRKSKVIINDKINPKFIPKRLHPEDNNFKLLLYFDLDAGNN